MEKYGCFLIRGSFIRRAGLRCSSYRSRVDQGQHLDIDVIGRTPRIKLFVSWSIVLSSGNCNSSCSTL